MNITTDFVTICDEIKFAMLGINRANIGPLDDDWCVESRIKRYQGRQLVCALESSQVQIDHGIV